MMRSIAPMRLSGGLTTQILRGRKRSIPAWLPSYVPRTAPVATMVGAHSYSHLAAPTSPLQATDGTTTKGAHVQKSFDYIILGAGSAGCVLANRILEPNRHDNDTVMLMDAGSHGALGGRKSLSTNPLEFWKFAMPSALTENLGPTADKANWLFQTTPQTNLNGRCIEQPRGKCLGGSSNLNAMVYARGHPQDFERWHADDMKPLLEDGDLDEQIDWDYASVLPYFKRAQRDATPSPPVPNYEHSSATSQSGSSNNNDGYDSNASTADLMRYKGTDGPLVVTNGAKFSTQTYPGKPNLLDRSILFDKFVEAGMAAGYPYTPDSNGYQTEGFGPLDQTVSETGERCSTERAYLSPLLDDSGKPKDPERFALSPNCHALRILFDGSKAIGVEYCNTKTGEIETAYAEKEVIVSLGAIGSPQLLMCSGVGPADHLKENDIDVVMDHPMVGANLQDHLEFYMQYMCKQPVTLFPVGNWMPTPWYRIMVGLEWFLRDGSGLAGSNQFETGGFIRSRAGIDHPNLQYHFVPGAVEEQSEFLPFHAFQVHCGSLRPSSRGTIRLTSKDSREAPLIDPNYLDTEEDVRDLRDGFKLTEEIIQTQPMDAYRGEALYKDQVDTSNDDSIDAWIRNHSHSAYHPSCTCAMGKVTDTAGRVFGMDGLRVVDASLMPTMTSGNLNAPTIMMAEKIADHVLGNAQLPKESADWFLHPQWETEQR